MTKTIFGTALLTTILLTLILAPTQVFAVSSNGFEGPYEMQNWSDAGIAGGTTSITPSSGPTSTAEFSYSVNLGNPGGGVTFRTATFSATAEETGIVSFDYEYSGFHAFFQTQIFFQTFADTSSGPSVTNTLESGPGSSFTKTGSATINVEQGEDFGFTIGGENFDSNSQISGTLQITNFRAPVVDLHDDILTEVQNIEEKLDDPNHPTSLIGQILTIVTAIQNTVNQILIDTTQLLTDTSQILNIVENQAEVSVRDNLFVNDIHLMDGQVMVLLDNAGIGGSSDVEVTWRLDDKKCLLLYTLTDVADGLTLTPFVDGNELGGNPAHQDLSGVEAIALTTQEKKNCHVNPTQGEYIGISTIGNTP